MAGSIGTSQLTRLLDGWSIGDGALHIRLESRLRSLVLSGRIPAGVRLPSERSLGSALSVSRNTVANAFDTLRGEGVFSSRQGDGTYVSSGSSTARSRGDDRLFSFVADRETSPAIDLRSAATPGLPMVAEALESLDFSVMRDLVSTHGYLPAGLPELRSRVAEYYEAKGMPTDAEQVLITSGAQQALRLAAASIVSPGSTVLVEEPTFRGAIESLRALGAHLVPIPPLDDADFAQKAATLIDRFRPALIVVQSTINNPTGRAMEVGHKRRLAHLAAAAKTPMIDDATMQDALIDEVDETPLAKFVPQLITVGSVSKSFWGGLRVGWIRADADTIARLAAVKGGEDLGTSLVAQFVAARLLPRIDESRARRRAELGRARASVLESLATHLPEWTPVIPQGGASLWIHLPEPIATAFAQRAERYGVRLLPGPTFSCVDQLDDWIRVSFAGEPRDTEAAIVTLASLWRSVTGGVDTDD